MKYKIIVWILGLVLLSSFVSAIDYTFNTVEELNNWTIINASTTAFHWNSTDKGLETVYGDGGGHAVVNLTNVIDTTTDNFSMELYFKSKKDSVKFIQIGCAKDMNGISESSNTTRWRMKTAQGTLYRNLAGVLSSGTFTAVPYTTGTLYHQGFLWLNNGTSYFYDYDNDENITVTLDADNSGQFPQFCGILYADTDGSLGYITLYNMTIDTLGGGAAPGIPGIPSVTLLTPTNADILSSLQINFSYNVSDEGGSLDNCSLYLNSTSGWGINATNLTITNATTNYFNNILLTNNDWLWNVNCIDNNSNSSFATSNYTLIVDTVNPLISADSIRYNKTFVLDLFTGQINASDNNLYSILALFDNQMFNNATDNITGILTTTYQYNWSYNVSTNSTGNYNLSFKVCDGHTSKLISEYDWSDGLFNNKLDFKTQSSEISITPKEGSIFDSMTTTKELDRYTFEYIPNDKGKQEYSFIITSNNYIDIVTKKDSKWNTWLVSGNNWIDFYEEDRPNEIPIYKRISSKEVEVTIKTNENDIFKFSSLGDLNCYEEVYQWYKYSYVYNYTTPTTEATTNNFTFNITTNTNFITDVNVTLLYNGTEYTPSEDTAYSGTTKIYTFHKNVTAPLVILDSNITFYWNFTIEGNETKKNNTDNFLQEVQNIGVDDCSGFATPVLNFTLLSEANSTPIKSDIEYAININYEGVVLNFSGNITNINNFSICINSNVGNYSADVLVQYSATNHDTRDWIKRNYTLDNVVDLVDLFLLLSASSTAVDIHVKDENEVDLSDVQIEVEKYYIANNSYETVSIESTDTGGDAQFLLEVGTTYYKFKFYQEGVLKLSTDTFKITDTALEYVISGGAATNPLVNWLRGQSVLGDITFINTSNTFSFTYTDPQDYASQVCMDITDGSKTYFTHCNTSSSSTMNFKVTEFNTTYTATASAKVGGTTYTIDTLSINLRDFWRQFGVKESLMYAMIIFLIITLIGIKSPQIATGMGVVALIGLYALGMIPAGLTALLGICTVGVILIFIMRERYYQ